MALVQDGKISLQDPLSKFFPGVPPEKKAVTVYHLLTHTSGIEQNTGLPYASRATREEFVRHVMAAPMQFEPGERFAYFNSGYALLAALVEVVSKKSFEGFMKGRIFHPAGMNDTGFIRDEDLDAKRAAGRLSPRGASPPVLSWHWGWGYRGMGGVVTTVHDLLKWDRALRKNVVLNAEMQAKSFEPFKAGYGLGWLVGVTKRGTKKVHHSGGVEGFVCNYARYLEDDAVIAVLSNGKSDVHGITKAIEDLLFQAPQVTARIDVGPFTLSQWKAVEFEKGTAWTVRKSGDEVLLNLTHVKKNHALAAVSLPVGPAKKLLTDLDRLLKQKRHAGPGQKAGMETGIYLNPYPLAGKKLSITKDLEVVLLPRYEGQGKDGKAIIDDRITLVLQQTDPQMWPVMVKMDNRSAQALLGALRKALK
jgi:hypothetical protein